MSLFPRVARRIWLRPFAWWLAGAGAWLAFAHAVLAQPQRPQLPSLPLVQLDERAASADLDNRTTTLTVSQPTPIRDVLLLVVRGTSLSIVPDPTIDGLFAGELKNVTVRQALDLILEPRGFDYVVDGTFIRVFRREPDTRIFDVNYIATERTGTTTVGVADGRSGAAVSTTTRTDVFAELAAGVRGLLSDHGVFNLDRKAGLLQVTDFPDRLNRVSMYLDAVHDRVHRQAQIDARVLEVELNDENATGIDWSGVNPSPAAASSAGARPPSKTLTSLRVANLDRLLQWLDGQGKVSVVANPRVLTLNNEPAIVRTETVTLSVTPQISDSVMTLSVSPLVKLPGIAESDMVVRLADGETLVVTGFTRDRESRERKAVGRTGGWFGRSTVVTRKRVELVILLTPRIVSGVMAP